MPQPQSERTAAELARKRFEEPRKGEVLVHLSPEELRQRSHELAEAVNRRARLVEGAKAYLQGVREQRKDLDEQIEVMSLEVEYGQHWIPAQQQLAGLYGAFEGGERRPAPGNDEEPSKPAATASNGKRGRGRNAEQASA